MASDADRRLALRTRRQCGCFRVEQAAADGVSYSTVHERLERGVYLELQPHVCAPASIPDSRDLRLMAAVLAVGETAAISHASAVAHLGLGGTAHPDVIHVVTAARGGVSVRGAVIHRTKELPDTHVRSYRSIPTTVPDRAIAELASMTGPAHLRRVVADANRRNLVTAESLRTMLDQLGRVRGKRMLLTILEGLSPLESTTIAELESLFLRVTTDAGIPPTALNYPVRDAQGARRLIDAVYLPEHVPIELDDDWSHTNRLDRDDDRRRERAIVLTGQWRSFLRYGWPDLLHRPHEVTAEIRAALAAAREHLGLAG